MSPQSTKYVAKALARVSAKQAAEFAEELLHAKSVLENAAIRRIIERKIS